MITPLRWSKARCRKLAGSDDLPRGEFIRIRALKLGQFNLNSTDYPIGDNIHGPASPVRGADGGFQAKERRSGIHKTMLKNNHGTPSVSDLLIDSVGFNLKQITDRSYQIFDP
jgi:hypothetical protein